jgi:SAM-dependent methyltransferase
MTDKQLISTIKYVAGTKPVFLLSEIIPYLPEPLSASQLYTKLNPELGSLNLSAIKKGADFEISRIQPVQPLVLNPEEKERLDLFFTGRSLPRKLEESIEEYLTKKVGKNWDDPVIIDRLRKAIVAQKDDYWRPSHARSLKYTKGYSVLSYLAYHFPVYFMQAEHLLAMLIREGLLKESMTVLDVGTGPGVVPLAIADFYSRLDKGRVVVHSLERSEEHVEAFMYLREQFTRKDAKASIRPPKKADITSPDVTGIPEKIDLMIFSNVLNELPDITMESRAEIVARMAESLSPDGSILIVEPADEENATRMRTLTVALAAKGLNIYSPCTFLWGTPCTAPRCWSFETAPAIRLTRVMETLAHCEDSYRYVNTDIKYSYAILRKDGKKKESCRMPAGSKFLRLSKVHLHVGKRINVVGVKMSGELGDARSHVYKICDGTARTPVYAVLPSYHITPENDMITSAPYGSILEMKGVLVRYNKEHDAYNLLVSRNTSIMEK